MTEKTCPLLMIMPLAEDEDSRDIKCDKNCAWYDIQEEQCAILVLSWRKE